MKVIAALSGGVDSAVAAARLLDDGHDVTGIHLALAEKQYTGGGRGCCTLADVEDARRVADVLGIPFYVWDFAERFREQVVEDFLAEYLAGRTPNPCIRCNEHIKFAAVLDRGRALGFDAVATGHYAQILAGQEGPELHRGADPRKDQSYVLGVLDFGQLQHALFPLGPSHKPEVRAEAARRGLRVADKPDSHDICFIPDRDTRAWLRAREPVTAGPIVDADTGEVVGTHPGALGFTIGQRRGLHLTQPTDPGAARYVVDVELGSNTVFVGPPARLWVRAIRLDSLRWATPIAPDEAAVTVQIRAHAPDVPATFRDGVLELAEPLSAVAPGQTAVLYSGTRVLGSGRIIATQ